MARPHAEEEEDKPLDPAVERVRRKLVRFIAINVGLLGVALMAVLAALVYKSTSSGGSQSQLPASAEIALPSGSRLVSQSLSGDRVSLDAELADGRRMILVYDLADRREVGRFVLVPQ